MVPIRRITRPGATICCDRIERGCNPLPAYPSRPWRNRIAPTSLPSRQALATAHLVSVSTDCTRARRRRDRRWPSSIPRRKSRAAGTAGLVHRQLIGPHMIEFPNHSRSYDRTRRAVRFWGHDSAIEASFFIDEGALKRIQPDARFDESGFLKAFDSNRDLICAAAAKVYVRGSRGSYDLVAANF